ncbi:MAG: FISUMP domain-containing protein [Bacteroidota bacterium]
MENIAACPSSVNYAGKTYNTVQIGTQCWFKENLNIGTKIPGTQEQTENGIIEKYCYDDLESNCDIYGGLYQWNEMMQYVTTQGVKGICHTGWHVPTYEEWATLTTFLGGSSVAGGRMKTTGTIEAGTGLWYSPNTGATNESGFTAVPAGYRYYFGPFYYIGSHGYWWNSSQPTASSAWAQTLNCSYSDVFSFYDFLSSGFSVRCLKDNTSTGYIIIHVKDQLSGSPLTNALVTTLSGNTLYTANPSGGAGYYNLIVPYGYGYNITASASGYSASTLSNINLIQGQPSPQFTVLLQPVTTNYSVVQIVPNPNPTVTEVPQGAKFHRYYKVMDQTTGLQAQGQNVEISSNGSAFYVTSDQDGVIDFSQQSTVIGNAGSSRTFNIVKVNGTNLTNPVSFSCSVIQQEYEKYWDNKVNAEIGGNYLGLDLSVEAEMGSVTTLIESNDQNNNPENIVFKRQGKAGGGVGFKVKSPSIGGQLGPIHGGIGAEAGLGAKFLGVTDDRYKFPYGSNNNWEAIAKYILLSDAGFKSLDNTLIRLLAVCENYFTDQNTLLQAFDYDAVGFDVVAEASASALAGINVSRNQRLGLNAYIGVKGFASYRFKNLQTLNLLENSFGLSGEFNAGAGLKFTTQANITNPIKLKLQLLDYQSTRGFEFSSFANKTSGQIEKYKISFQRKNQSENEKFTYEISGDALINTITTLHPTIFSITNSLFNPSELNLENNSFGQIADVVFTTANSLQANNSGQAKITYSKEITEIQEESDFPVSIELSLTAISANVGGGYGFERGKKMIVEEGEWIKGTHFDYYNYEDQIPDISKSYQQVFQETINDIPLWLRILIGTIHYIFPWMDNQIIDLGDQGSFAEFPDNAFPPGIDSLSCSSWGWWGDTISSRAPKLPEAKKVIFQEIKKRAESLYGMTYGIGGFYQFEPYGLSLLDTCWLTIAYTKDEVDSINESSLAVYREDKQNQKWVYLGGLVDTVANTVKVPFTKLALFTLAQVAPYGRFSLNALPDSVYADSLSTSIITSNTIFNNDSSSVSNDQMFTVTTSLGWIINTDVDTARQGVQIYPVNGILNFQVASSDIGGMAIVSAYSVNGSAHASDTIIMFDTAAPMAPLLHAPVHLTDNCGLKWDYHKEKDVAGFRVYFDIDSIPPFTGPITVFGSPSPLNIGKDTSAIVYGLIPDSTYYMTVTAFDVSGNESDYSNIQQFHMIPGNRNIQNVSYPGGIVDCKDGLEMITTAGAGQYFTVENGAVVNLIAGQKIKMFPGTIVNSGGFLHGYIAWDSIFCGNVKINDILSPLMINKVDDPIQISGEYNKFFRIYPNPTTGRFTLELKGELSPDKIKVDVYGMRGERILSEVLKGERKYEFSLSDSPIGVYFIRVITGDKIETVKIIKQ